MKIKYTLPLLVLFSAFEAINPFSIRAAVENPIVRPNIIVSAAIGIPKMTLWGYGPAKSFVELTGIDVNQNTQADEKGYFVFDPVYLPTSGDSPELCLTAVDTEGRVTPPTCIPPIPQGNFFYDVGPVLLPPTITLGAPETHTGSQVSAQGQTIPDSSIEIKLAHPDMKSAAFSLVKTAFAYYVPSYEAVADANGNYSFNMPTTKDNTWRVFAIADSEMGKSPKSNTLKFESLSATSYAWKTTRSFLASLFTWPRILIPLFILLLLIVWIILSGKRKRNKKHQNTSEDIN